MSMDRNRLVPRILERLQLAEQTASPAEVSAFEVAELQSRLRRLSSLGGRFPHVRLSAHVAPRGSKPSHRLARGAMVSTEG